MSGTDVTKKSVSCRVDLVTMITLNGANVCLHLPLLGELLAALLAF